jgi:hypothetical protein
VSTDQRSVARRATARGPARPPVAALPPATVTPETWAFLGHHVERAFVRPGAWRATLRTAVRRVVVEVEMEMFGAEPGLVHRTLERAVMEHPACAQYDRMLIVTGERYSHRVIAAMHAWAEAERATVAAASSPARQ